MRNELSFAGWLELLRLEYSRRTGHYLSRRLLARTVYRDKYDTGVSFKMCLFV